MMALIDEEMKKLIEEQKLSYVATASTDGRPNVSPKGSIIFIDGDTLAFAAVRSEKTVANLAQNPYTSVAVLDVGSRKGFQFKGKAEMVKEGAVYNRVVTSLKKRLPHVPDPKFVVIVRVDEVYPF